MLERKPKEVIFKAIKNMLPKNRLQNQRLKRLRIFIEEETDLKVNFKEYKTEK